MGKSYKSVPVALVTGAAKGIGRGIACRLAADGFDVAVNDLEANSDELDDVTQQIRQCSRRSVAITADVSESEAVEKMVRCVVDKLGQLNIMVANAGVTQVATLLDLTPEEWDHMMAINARGVFLCYQAAARQMVQQDTGGKIIGAASIAAYRSSPWLGHYAASKWAIRGLTQAAAMEWANYGITVNAYCPGIVDTAMWDLIDAKISEVEGKRKGEVIKNRSEQIALGRVSIPEDVAGLVSYLASRDSDYMTGQSIIIDGGIWFS